MEQDIEFDYEKKCPVCKAVGKGGWIKYIEEGEVWKMFVCECGHEEL